MKAYITINITIFLLCIGAGCRQWVDGQMAERAPLYSSVSENEFTVPGHQINHPDVYSVQLFREDSDQSAPIIQLGTGEQIMLRFDILESGARQFRISITHHNPDWTRSPLPPEGFLEGFSEAFFGGGSPSRSQDPLYRQYEYIFPNSQLRFTESGNYILHIEDYNTREPIFSLPFFIHENAGEIVSSIETIRTPRQDLRILHQPNSRYTYPDFVEFPQFDLQFHFAQNQFWGRSRETDVRDITTPGSVYFEVPVNRAFIGDYEFHLLDLPELTMNGPEIVDFQPGYVPPRIFLNIDVQGFSNLRREIPANRFGRPNPDRNARYGDVYFQFQPEQEIGETQKIYLAGDFNNWKIQDDLRLQKARGSNLWKVNTIIKEGSYSYKYLLVEDGNIYDLSLDDTFTRSRQEYTTFVYLKDPVRQHYRLLQTNTFYSN